MLPPTDDEIQDFIAKKIAYFRASMKNKNYGRNLSSDEDSTCQSNYIMPKSNSVVSLHTTSGFDKNMERQSLSRAAIELCTDAVGRTLQEELTESTLQSKETGDCATSVSNKYLTSTLASAEGNLEHAPETKSFEKSLSLDFDLLVKEHLNVTMLSNGSRKLVYSDNCEDKTFINCNCKFPHCGTNKGTS